MGRVGFRLGLGRKLGIATCPSAASILRMPPRVAEKSCGGWLSRSVRHRSRPARRLASLDHDRAPSSVTHRRVAAVKKHTPFVSRNNAGDTKTASNGLASFYTEGTQTASGEKFNTLEMTAAHPTLPFGTKLRVTDVASDRSVTVRVNDRGPYVHGRVVDVSYSAANALGMIGKGVANVKLDVVR